MKKLINKTRADQRGLTMISWMIVLVFLLFQAVIAMNVIPVYMNDSSVKKIIKDLPNDIKARNESSTKGLKSLVMQRLNINNIYSIKTGNVTVKTGRGFNTVTIKYEPRGKLIGNLEYIVSFEHTAKVPTR
jgi:Flp pilus assembly protein TadG